MKKGWKIALALLLSILMIAGGYVAYVLIAYHRIGDQPIEPWQGEATAKIMQTGQTYRMVSWNIGFGAYEDDYSFFMDGGKQSWAWSAERLATNMNGIAEKLAAQKADIYVVQEVDFDSTRTYHIDERQVIRDALPGYYGDFCQNYDSPFLFYPFNQPHGSNRSGLLTFSVFPMTEAKRVELPVEDSLMKLVDLDRCYSVQRLPVASGKELVLFNTHLSAYTSDGTIATDQLRLLLEHMKREYDAGNYCILGGDMNKDLSREAETYFGKADKEYTWAQPIPEGFFDGSDMTPVVPFNDVFPVPSCRNADSAYHAGQFVVTLDGFVISPNVKAVDCNVIDTAFRYSDHNPVYLEFVLEE